VTALVWDAAGARRYETGINKGVLYIPDGGGNYSEGYAWNGLSKITEKPTGAAATATYADNIKYLNLISVEEFAADIEAYTYPEQFGQCDGTYEPEPGVAIAQQSRKPFGLCYRTLIGNDTAGTDLGYKLHLVYGALAAPSQKDFASVNANPVAIAFVWSVTTTPVNVSGHKPTATLTIDSTKVDATALATLEQELYGTIGQDPRLPLPDEVLALFSGTVTLATPTEPTYNSSTHTVTIPAITGVTYYVGGVAQAAGPLVIAANTFITAEPNAGYRFDPNVDNDWEIVY
jgi:hypothetical protein